MADALPAITILLLGVVVLLLLLLLRRPAPGVAPDPAPRLEAIERAQERTGQAVREELARGREEAGRSLREQRQELAQAIHRLSGATETRLETLRTAVEEKLEGLRADNARQLEEMRRTVDEKLQGTLEQRLGESFRQVSERLEMVHKGLGEMQSLATGVGDLKKVLSNVKTRGTWGEVQLGALLEQVLTPAQYALNVATREGGERVEYAVRLPGQGQGQEGVVWLPLDAKFPVEDWQRLLEAQERADAPGVEAAGKQLEARVRAAAADISRKYLNPPATTDFAILFLPIEGLFAEVIRRAGLAETVQRESRVVLAGPTTLWALLNSLQMGFRTLAIQQRSGEVWNLLAAVKTEWARYGQVLDAVGRKLQQASEKVEEVQRRSRAVGRTLRSVQELPVPPEAALFPEEAAGEGDAAPGEP
jgi:DNA recombination protein RmuC